MVVPKAGMWLRFHACKICNYVERKATIRVIFMSSDVTSLRFFFRLVLDHETGMGFPSFASLIVTNRLCRMKQWVVVEAKVVLNLW